MFGLLGGVRSVKCYHCSGADTIQPSLFFPFIVPCLFEKGDIVFSFPRYAMRGSASSDSKYLVSVTLPTALCKSFLKQVFVMVWICIWFRYTTQITFIYFFQHFDFNHFPAHILSTHVGSTQLTHNVATTSLHRRCNVVVCWVWVLCVRIYYSFMQIFLKLYWCFVMVWRCVFDKKKNPVVYSTDRCKAVVQVLVLLFGALWFILRGDLLYVLYLVLFCSCVFQSF